MERTPSLKVSQPSLQLAPEQFICPPWCFPHLKEVVFSGEINPEIGSKYYPAALCCVCVSGGIYYMEPPPVKVY